MTARITDAVRVETRAASLAARYFAGDTGILGDEHFGVGMGWSIHQDWSGGASEVYGADQWLTSEHRRVGYLARQIICGDMP